MKHYPKIYQDLSRLPSKKICSSIGSSAGSVDELAALFRNFYKEAYPILFDLIVKQVWLEQKFLYNGARRAGRFANGNTPDWAFSYFMKSIVGISQKPLTTGFIFVSLPSYIPDLFPTFSDHNPFEEPEFFKFPYKNITIDHMMFCYQYHDRIEMLKEADEKVMNIKEFMDWATNHVLSYNKDKSKEIYSICRHSFFPYIKRNKKI